MPSKRTILADIHDHGLDPKRRYSGVRNGRLLISSNDHSAEEAVTVEEQAQPAAPSTPPEAPIELAGEVTNVALEEKQVPVQSAVVDKQTKQKPQQKKRAK